MRYLTVNEIKQKAKSKNIDFNRFADIHVTLKSCFGGYKKDYWSLNEYERYLKHRWFRIFKVVEMHIYFFCEEGQLPGKICDL